MLYYMFALLTASLVVIVHDPRKEANRWASLFLLFAASGGSSELLTQHGYDGWAAAVMFINQTLTPYGLLVFMLVYTNRMKELRTRTQWLVKIVLLLPVVIMAAVTPFTPKPSFDYTFMLIWTGPYYASAIWLLLSAYRKETDRERKRSLFLTSLIMVPTLVAVILFIVIARSIYPEFDFFKYMAGFLTYSIAVALPGVFVYGVLGVKLKFERDSMETAMSAMGSGASLLQHTVKNEIGKIAISADILKHVIEQYGLPAEAAEQLRIIENASDQMMAMAQRMRERMSIITFSPQPCRLDRLLDTLLDTYRKRCMEQQICIETDYAIRPIIRCDAVHAREAIGNLLANAMEAMPGGGQLKVSVHSRRRGVVLAVQDSGAGIAPAQLSRVLEPFYSTKQRVGNYGLGLSYVYLVMQRSGGSVNMMSRPGVGTTVQLWFPRSTVIRMNEHREVTCDA
ncbi:sensor histidine kinase [Paenibacillus xylaniclasticus]|uniref:sensor histidine kinase n=1 Tax=Paenibacillus xylaniclasticus TaxID=588083 RepID=UPI000FDA3777|nr:MULTISPECIES: sensor histidine kinase [Paenibacillus]GFN31745.1 hypothetical protein PCURB6_20050 [Paenibacillus curdlanolyticus]